MAGNHGNRGIHFNLGQPKEFERQRILRIALVVYQCQGIVARRGNVDGLRNSSGIPQVGDGIGGCQQEAVARTDFGVAGIGYGKRQQK